MTDIVTPYPLVRADRARNILITGAPNYAALQLVWRIVETEPDATICLVVRGDVISAVEGQLAQRSGVRERVRVFRGNPCDANLGMQSHEFGEVANSTTDVFHMLAEYHSRNPKSFVEEININGTRHTLQSMAHFSALKRFHYYSTAFVCGDRDGVVLESELLQGQSFRNTYERTRYTAELDVRRVGTDLPVTIYRPAMVVGDTRSGEMQTTDGAWRLIQNIVRDTDRPPTIPTTARKWPFNVVPADYVAAAMHAISLRDDSLGKTYHIVDPAPFSVGTAFRLILQHSGPAGSVFEIGDKLMQTISRSTALERILGKKERRIDELESRALFNSANTQAALRGTGIQCPQLLDYLEVLVKSAGASGGDWEKIREPSTSPAANGS